MKLTKTVLFLILGLVVLGGAGGIYWHKAGAPQREREQRIKGAAAVLASYQYADWAALFDEAEPLIAKHPQAQRCPPTEWTPRIRQLNPSFVDVSGGTVFLSWTEKPGEDRFYLWILRNAEHSGNVLEPAGIRVVGPYGQPERRPYTFLTPDAQPEKMPLPGTAPVKKQPKPF